MLRPQMNEQQIMATFGLCERPLKRLIRDYFVQFDSAAIKKGLGPRTKLGELIPKSAIPQDYSDLAGMMRMVHGDGTKNTINTSKFTPDSLLKIPPDNAHLSIPQKTNPDGTVSIWGVDLHLRSPDSVFNKEAVQTFCAEAEPDPDTAAQKILPIIGGFFPSTNFVFELLKSKNKEMKTLKLAINPLTNVMYIEDTQFPNIAPNKVLVVKFSKKGDFADTKESTAIEKAHAHREK